MMMFYEGSVGDKMARLKAGKLPLSDVLRYYLFCEYMCGGSDSDIISLLLS